MRFLPSRMVARLASFIHSNWLKRLTWVKHLADYNVIPPFSQLERTSGHCDRRTGNCTNFKKTVAETELNAMTFKGRAERLGWVRGSVCAALAASVITTSGLPGGGRGCFR